MNRRAFTFTALGAIAFMRAPTVRSQQPKLRRVGVLYVGAGAPVSNLDALRQAFHDLGWVEGKNLSLVVRSADGRVERLPEVVAELLGLGVDVLVTGGSEATRAAKQATTSIPIVFQGPSYPVEEGLVASFPRPGGNVTGISIAMADTLSKHLQLLRDAVPAIASVAIIWSPANPGHTFAFRDTERAAKSLQLKIESVPMTAAEDLPRAFATMRRVRPHALIVQPGPLITAEVERICQLAIELRIPSISIQHQFTEQGLLMSYGANFRDAPQRVAAYVHRILNGAKPADLPVERPTKFELAINMKTAAALGLSIPQPMLLRADQVIK